MGPTDLDSSLDDIIKKNKRRSPESSRGGRERGGRGGRGGSRGANTIIRRPPRGRGISSNERFDNRERFDSRTNKSISKPKLDLRGRIGRYNGSSASSRSDDRRENAFNNNTTRVEKKEKIDPASIIITKAITRPSASKKTASLSSSSSVEMPAALKIQGKGSYGSAKQMYSGAGGYSNHKQDEYHMEEHQQQQQHIMRPTASGQIDTYAGNTIVLICNLDPAATAEDIGETCSQFGPIVSCDILLDQHGRPLSKAEIEFVYHTSAQECVTKLDNQIADGRVLRAFLKSKATPPAAPRYSSRTVMSNPQGSEYNSPQLSVRYDQNRMPQGNMHSRHYSHYPSQY